MTRRHALGLGLALVSAACGTQAPSGEAAGARARLVLLGTGTPNADPARSGPAVAVVVGETAYLVDAGPGVVRRAAAAAARGIAALEAPRLRRVFLTHLHSDHTLGLPDLIFSPWVLEREEPLEVWGPPGTQAMVNHLQAAYRADVRRRIDGRQPQNVTGWRARVHEIAPGDAYRDSQMTVTPIPVPHEEWDAAYGYRFEGGGRVIVVSGDTRASEALVSACDGCDILLHEVYSDAGFARRAPEWQRYHAAAHTSASALGRLAGRARPDLLVLYHQLFWGTAERDLVEEVKATYDGPVVSGHDLDVF